MTESRNVSEVLFDIAEKVNYMSGRQDEFLKQYYRKEEELEKRLEYLESSVSLLTTFRSRATFIPVIVLFLLAVAAGLREVLGAIKWMVTR